MKTPLVSLRRVSVSYDGHDALKEVDLDIYPDDFLGIIGPNGGGKTTLVKAIVGTIPYRGTITYSPQLFRGKERLIGYMPQQSIFDRSFPISVLEVVMSGLQGQRGFHARYASGDRAKAQELLRTKGFRRPELVVWYDGEYTNLTRTPEAEMAVFRVEISSEQNLSDTVKQAIAQAAPGCDLSRVGADLFVVGQFDNKAVADQAAAAIRAADPQLSVKVTEIAK